MTEIRQNKATKQWVIYSTARSKRPRDFVRRGREKRGLPEYDAHLNEETVGLAAAMQAV